jgi:hypothetical protein
MSALFALALGLTAAAAQDPVSSEATRLPPTDGVQNIDLVVCLDTSGSMERLIDSARGRLWDVVNRLHEAAPGATIRVGLLSYGSPSGSRADEGWVVRRSGLSTDLDSVYAEMTSLRTSGGDEYVGWVVHDAVQTMDWTPDGVRMIFVAGNESADQGRAKHDFRTEVAAARERGILVNALFAGHIDMGTQELWAEVARAGGGAYAAIDMAAGTRQIDSPVDARLQELNARLNATYVPYGAQGGEGKERQLQMDAAASAMGLGGLGSRAATKGSSAYSNAHWDLLDGVQQGNVDLGEATGLPPELRGMSEAERRAWVAEKQAERAQLQAEIQQLGAERARYVEAERKKARAKGEISFDDALIEAAEAAIQ